MKPLFVSINGYIFLMHKKYSLILPLDHFYPLLKKKCSTYIIT